jgi:hypothetical protein
MINLPAKSSGGGGSGTVCQGQRKGKNAPIAAVMDYVLLAPRVSRDCVPAFLQTSSLCFFSRHRFQLEQFSIRQPRDGSQYSSERDICIFNHVAFHRRVSQPRRPPVS